MSYVFTHAEIGAIRTYWPMIQRHSGAAQVTPFVLVGLGSRESNWGLGLTPHGPAGTGDFAPRVPKPALGRTGTCPPDHLGFGRGLLQLDWDAQPFARNGNWRDPEENVAEGCKVLLQCRTYFLTHMPSLTGVSLLRASLAAYNHGPGNVLRNIRLNGITGVDVGTTNHNYSMDVLDRASSFENLHALAPAQVAGEAPAAELDLDPIPAPEPLFQAVSNQADLAGLGWRVEPEPG